jgi:hypothetical protein|nr:MAG TPA: hypothetical protein [Caudoviricetes sp.]
MAKEKSITDDAQQAQVPDEGQTFTLDVQVNAPMQETEIQRNLRIAAALRREHSVNELEVLRNENRMLKQQLQALRTKQADA